MEEDRGYSVNTRNDIQNGPTFVGVVNEQSNNSSSTKSGPENIIYRRRWYILLLFSLLAGTQGGIWNTWGPLNTSAIVAFGWGTDSIALLENWGPITYIISIVLFTWLIDVKGLRWACVVSAGLVAAGTAVRCITSEPPATTWLMHLGQLLNGLGGPVSMGGPPAVSAVWFPANQRTTATCLGTISNGLGVALAFIIGPLLVPVKFNVSAISCNGSDCWDLRNGTEITTEDRNAVRWDIMKLMYIEFGWTAAVFLAMLIYFPSKPPTPPCITASIDRLDYKAGIKALVRHRRFWLLAGTYAVSTGVVFAWQSLIAINLAPLGVTETQAGWIGFYSVVVGNTAGMVISIFADIFKRRMKMFLIALYSFGTLAFILFALSCIRVIPYSLTGVTIMNVAAAISVSGAVPLLYELVCETTYPVAEGLTNGVMTWLNNCVGLTFYLVMMIPMGTAWMNWAALGSTAVCIPIFFLYEEHYIRLDIDTHQAPVTNTQDSDTRRLIGDVPEDDQ